MEAKNVQTVAVISKWIRRKSLIILSGLDLKGGIESTTTLTTSGITCVD